MRRLTEVIGRLTCRTVDDLPANARPRLLVVMCHGYGASGTDLVPLADELFDQFPALQEHVQFVFPEAPLSLEELGIPGGCAWWPIDMLRLQLAVATGRFQEMQRQVPAGLVEARDMLLETLSILWTRTGRDASSTVLGGFSQGAMLSVETALHLDTNLASLLVYSGTLINGPHWQERASHHAGLSVLQSHGAADPILPFGLAQALQQLLLDAGCQVTFVPFGGGHQIPWEVLEQTGDRLTALVKSS